MLIFSTVLKFQTRSVSNLIYARYIISTLLLLNFSTVPISDPYCKNNPPLLIYNTLRNTIFLAFYLASTSTSQIEHIISTHYRNTTFNTNSMKTFLSFFFLSLLITCNLSGFGTMINASQADSPTSLVDEDVLQIVSSSDLSELTFHWVTEFNKLHPELKITTSLKGDNSPVEPGNIYLLSSFHLASLPNEANWKMVVAHDLIVPICNADNPLLGEMCNQGISPENFKAILTENPEWSKLAEGFRSQPIHTFIPNDEQVVSTLASFTSVDESAIRANRVSSAKEMIAAIQDDQYAIGFCKLVDVLKSGTNVLSDQISIIPIDKNRNGRLDSFENIYNDPNQLIRGAWLGKYPHELRGDTYAMASSEPSGQAALAFLSWLNKEGQNHLENSGFVVLSTREREDNTLALTQPVAFSEPAASPLFPVGWQLAFGMAAVLIVVVLLLSRRKRKVSIESEDIATTPALNEQSVLAPAGLYYSKSHTWAYREPDGMVIVGIDDFMQHLTGRLTQVKMKAPGEKVRKGDHIVTLVHEGKQLELYSPVSGTIELQNKRLKNQPEGINTAPYTNGWIYTINPSNWYRETRFLFTVENYRDWLEDEFIRLKDFLAALANANQTVFKQLILQDGGELTDNVLADLDPEVWEDFQTRFIDKGK